MSQASPSRPTPSPKPPPLAAAIIAFAGGAAGTVLRAATRDLGAHWHVPTWLPTLAVNVVATFIAGFLGRMLLGHLTRSDAMRTEILDPAEVRAHRLAMLGVTGFCGGLSTFSALGADMSGLVHARHLGELSLLILLSLGLGLPSAWAGLALGWRLNRHR